MRRTIKRRRVKHLQRLSCTKESLSISFNTDEGNASTNLTTLQKLPCQYSDLHIPCKERRSPSFIQFMSSSLRTMFSTVFFQSCASPTEHNNQWIRFHEQDLLIQFVKAKEVIMQVFPRAAVSCCWIYPPHRHIRGKSRLRSKRRVINCVGGLKGKN